jgi:kynureninase
MIIPTLDQARELDRKDPLGHYREQFRITDRRLIYLDGNSLGRMPEQAVEDITTATEQAWGERLIRSWNEGWYTRSAALGDRIAAIAGASEGEMVVCDATSVNLYKLAFAAMKKQAGRKKIITDNLNFPSDVYVLQGLVEQLGEGYELVVLESRDGMTIETGQLREAIDDDTALVSLSHVVFKSAFMYDMKGVTELVHQKGAMVLWDLSHSIGAVQVDLNGAGADLAVGCTYKYLNGGPGAPAFLYVRKDLQDQLQSPIWGWFGEASPFEFGLEYRPGKGIGRFLAGTPPILSMVPVERTLEMLAEAGMARVRRKSMEQLTFLETMAATTLFRLGFSLGSPADRDRRGSHLSLRHPEAYRISQALIDPGTGKYQVIPDFREPDNIRLGISPLYTTYEEIYLAVQEIQAIVQEEWYRKMPDERGAVT